ncbi:aminodeoxychorismate/anthranilate synthase component II [Alkalibaculum sp. M08DMB]|uniref:Aminodeoxychorismate/anthranilate synthase component II n=1 Tax=Alkalibaculum sporogenes TaxID=2655001 RepID=A0A6A7K6M8_9FIRM|nr:aminodeoxychorismate/anthranilate synthase component II [Alkalibaculum sporogenes]MPW25086.1 aminodeoxychorismate/anthranilate synthase component II [Alkalibaculum sporogenes]
MILMIDNYDSFTYNLVQYLGCLGQEVLVKRNDKITLKEIEVINPMMIVLSPGPCTPNETGICLEIIDEFKGKIPILGICLGHQTIGQAFGCNIIQAKEPVHGKVYPIKHNNQGVFYGLNNPFKVTRYHSLIIERENMPDCFEITALTEEGEIMGIKHKKYPIEGVQFHPEAILTEQGMELLENFYEMAKGMMQDVNQRNKYAVR